MRALILAVFVACATPPKPVPIVVTQAPAPEPHRSAPVAPEHIDPVAVAARSKAFFDAYDRHELDAVVADLAPSFVLFEDARFMDEKTLRSIMQARIDRHAAVH